MGVYGGIVFCVVLCVILVDDCVRIIFGLSIKCFNIGEKWKIILVKLWIIWEKVGLLL